MDGKLNLTDKTTEIQIPSKIYKNINIKNLDGDIAVESIKVKSMILYSANGNIEVEKINNDKLDIKSENGENNLVNQINNKDKKLTVQNNCGDEEIQLIKFIKQSHRENVLKHNIIF